MSVDPRRLALPLCALATPPLYLLYREATLCGTPAGCSRVALAGYVGLSLLAPVGAWLVARAVAAGRGPEWLAPRPDDPTLAVLAAIVVALVTYLLTAAVGVVPGWLDAVLAPVGGLLGLPFALVHAMSVGFGDTLGEPSMAVQRLVAAVGAALSGAWWYLLADTAARGVVRITGRRG